MARPVVGWLRERGFEVFEEVFVPKSRGTADIVATHGPVTLVVEVKSTMSLVVLGQARNWEGRAHMIYIAVPWHKRGSAADGAAWICGLAGVGLLYVSKAGKVKQVVSPTFVRKADCSRVRSALRPEQADGRVPAGSRNLGVWTPWRETVRNLTDFVRANPGATLDQALSKIKYHYTSLAGARRALSAQITKGIIKEVRLEGGAKGVRLFPA